MKLLKFVLLRALYKLMSSAATEKWAHVPYKILKAFVYNICHTEDCMTLLVTYQAAAAAEEAKSPSCQGRKKWVAIVRKLASFFLLLLSISNWGKRISNIDYDGDGKNDNYDVENDNEDVRNNTEDSDDNGDNNS